MFALFWLVCRAVARRRVAVLLSDPPLGGDARVEPVLSRAADNSVMAWAFFGDRLAGLGARRHGGVRRRRLFGELAAGGPDPARCPRAGNPRSGTPRAGAEGALRCGVGRDFHAALHRPGHFAGHPVLRRYRLAGRRGTAKVRRSGAGHERAPGFRPGVPRADEHAGMDAGVPAAAVAVRVLPQRRMGGGAWPRLDRAGVSSIW